MDWFKYDRIIANRAPSERKQQAAVRNSVIAPPCRPDCWLRRYDPPPALPERTDFNPYIPKSSPVYRRIKSTQIRVLRLYPGRGNRQIVTELLPARLTGSDGTVEIDADYELIVPFRILSYSWGYGGNTTFIKCNGYDFEVLDSLCQALLELRDVTEPLYYWIDAMCINQTDLDEKAVQIRKIFSLYSQASQTSVWLGRMDQCGFEAYRYLLEFDKEQHRPECMRGVVAVSRGLSAMAARPWFSRTWVRQEVFASPSIIVQIGPRQIEYKLLQSQAKKALKWLEHLKNDPSIVNAIDTNGIRQLVRNLTNFERVEAEDRQNIVTGNYQLLLSKPELSLEHMLRGSSYYKATNARDFIYGVISMTSVPTFVGDSKAPVSFGDGPIANKTNEPRRTSLLISLPIHYNRPLAHVFAEATLYLMRFHESPDLMLLNSQLPRYQLEPPTQSSSIRDTRLPSWATNWRHTSQHTFLDSVWLLTSRLVYHDGPASLHGRREEQKANFPDLQGDCGVQYGERVYWNDRASFEHVARNRPVLGCDHNGAFSNEIRELMHRRVSVDTFMDPMDGLLKLSCFGSVLGSIGRRVSGGGAATAQSSSGGGGGVKKRFRDKMNPLWNERQSFDVTQRYFKESVAYMQRVASPLDNNNPSQRGSALESGSGVVEVEFLPLHEIAHGLPNKDTLYKSTKPIARMQNFDTISGMGGWTVSLFCYVSDIGRILAHGGSCLVPAAARDGDLVVWFRGCSLPTVLRTANATHSGSVREEYEVIGPLVSWRYVAEESLRRIVAGLWLEYGRDFEFREELERVPAPLEEDLNVRTFVLV